MDQFKLAKKITVPTYKVPRSVQQVIPIYRISKDGIFEIKENSLFDKVYQFDDINYTIGDAESQKDLFGLYCQFLNSMSIKFKIVIANHNKDMEKFREEIMFTENKDSFNKYRKSYNKLIENRMMKGRQGIEQVKYIVVSTEQKNYEEAKNYFNTIENNMRVHFSNLDSYLYPIDADGRMKILHSMYNTGEEHRFQFDFDEALHQKRDWRNDICPVSYKEQDNHIKSDKMYFRTLFIKSFPKSDISDEFLTDIAGVSFQSVITVDVTPIPDNIVTKKLEKLYMNNENAINRQEKTRNRLGQYSVGITYSKRKEKEQIEELLDANTDANSKTFFTGVTILITAHTMDELDYYTEILKGKGDGKNVVIQICENFQHEAFMTTLPVAGTYIKTARSLDTESLAGLIPFNVYTASEPGGQHYGVNQINKALIRINRRKLSGGHGQVFGKTGFGKTMGVKDEIMQLYLGTDEHIVIIDPLSEYFDLVKNLGGEVINLTASSGHYLNPLEIPKNIKNAEKFIASRSEFMISIMDNIFKDSLNAKHNSIMNRCIENLYAPLIQKSKMESPIIPQLYDILTKQPEQESDDLSLGLELLAKGTFDLFSKQSNVDIRNRITTIGMKELGKKNFAVSMLVVLETLKGILQENAAKGILTRVYVDEEHYLLKKELSATFLEEFFKVGRHWLTIMTGMTQNVIDCLRNETSQNIISNCEFVMLLKQSPNDRDEIAKVFNIPGSALQYVNAAPAGTGLIKYGNKLIPFDNDIPEDSLLYEEFNSD